VDRGDGLSATVESACASLADATFTDTGVAYYVIASIQQRARRGPLVKRIPVERLCCRRAGNFSTARKFCSRNDRPRPML